MKIAVLDIETTGFLNQGGKIVEIGIVELDLTNGSTKVLFDNVVHESGITRDEVENSWIVKNSSLTVEEIRHSKNLNHYRSEIQGILNEYTTTAFNKAFDFGFLRNRGFRIDYEFECPMLVATNVCQLPSNNGRAGFKWPKVEEAIKFMFPEKLGYIEEHRGCQDAIDEAEIVYWLHKNGHFKKSLGQEN